MSTFRKAYSLVGALLILEFLAQFYLIATAIFTLGQAFYASSGNPTSKAIYTSFKNADPIAGAHVANGYFVIPITTLVLIGLSFAARHTRRTTVLTALLAVLLLLQDALIWVAIPGVTALHALNAVVLVALAGWLTWTNWAWRTTQPAEALRRAGEPAPEGGTTP
jgi:hypothetical protein